MEYEIGIAGYALGKRLYASPEAIVYQGVRTEDRRSVAIKVFGPESSLAGHAREEFDALRACACPHVPEVLALDTHGPRHALVFEWLECETARAWVHSVAPVPVERLLSIAVQLAEALVSVHAAGYVHRGITPGTVRVSHDGERVWLTHFDLAMQLGRLPTYTEARRMELAGSIAYLPPEQTGWIERSCDFRSDLYAVGATLYRLVTGRRPFEAGDTAGVIRAVLTQLPRAPHEVEPSVPRALSRLILRLMNKEPADRHPTAAALAADCRALLEQQLAHGEIDPEFRLGLHEAPDAPSFGSKLHGRERELELLLQCCRGPSATAPRLCIVTGPSGAGASAVLDELRLRLLRAGARVAYGRFLHVRGRPYAGLADALESLVTQVLLASDAQLEAHRRELRESLGPLARVVIELVPDLGAVLGDSPRLPRMSEQDMQERLAYAIERFLEAFAHVDDPLVLLLDDFTVSDAGSVVVLERLAASKALSSLTIVLGARADGQGDVGGIRAFLGRCTQKGVALETVQLGSLPAEAARAWLEEVLGGWPHGSDALLERMRRATDCLPLLMREFILNLHARGALEFHGGAWHCSTAALQSVPVADGAAALLASKLEHLDAHTRNLLEAASCIAIDFDADLVSAVAQDDAPELHALLMRLERDGYLIQGDRGLRFAHRDIRQAAQLALSPQQRATFHCRVAQHLLRRIPEERRGSHVFDIVHHLNEGASAQPPEIQRVSSRLNLEAATQLVAAGAGADADSHLRAADAAFGPEGWREDPALGFAIHLKWVEARIQQLQIEGAHALLDGLELRHPSRDQRIQISLRRLGAYALGQWTEDTGRYTLRALAEVGIRWPERPSWVRVRFELWRTGRLLAGRRHDDYREAKLSENREHLLQLMFLRQAAGLLTRAGPRFGCLTGCTVMRAFVRFGYVESPAAALVGFAYWSWHFERDRARVERYIEATRHWIARFPESFVSAHAEMQLDGVLMAWLGSRRAAIPKLLAIHERMLGFGHLEYATAARVFAALYAALGGEPIEHTSQELWRIDRTFSRSATRSSELGRMARSYDSLLAASLDPGELRVTARDDDAFIRETHTRMESAMRALWMMVHVVYGQFDEAVEQFRAMLDHMPRLSSAPPAVDVWFYHALAASQLAITTRGRVRRRHLRELRASLRSLRRAAVHGPDYTAMRMLAETESLRAHGRERGLRARYKEAASRATQQCFPHHAALAFELWARSCLHAGRIPEARNLLGQARVQYQQWGASAKAKLLEQECAALHARSHGYESSEH